MTMKAGEYKLIMNANSVQRIFDANGNVIHVKYSDGDEFWYDNKGNQIRVRKFKGYECWFDSDGNDITKEQYNVIHSQGS